MDDNNELERVKEEQAKNEELRKRIEHVHNKLKDDGFFDDIHNKILNKNEDDRVL